MDAQWLDIGPVDQLPALGARTLPVQGGVVLDMSRMDKILETDTEDRLVRLQPGVTRVALNDGQSLRPEKQLFAYSIVYLFALFAALALDRWFA